MVRGRPSRFCTAGLNPINTFGKSPWETGHGNSDPVRPESVTTTDAEISRPGSSGDNRKKDRHGETTEEKPISQELQEEIGKQESKNGADGWGKKREGRR